jgi:hypothetical protein
MTYAISATIQGDSAPGSGTITQEFKLTVTLQASTSDSSLTLGGLDDPLYIGVFGAKGCSFKLGSGGTDVIGCFPFGVVTDEDGLSETIVLLSNSDSVAHEVTVYAGQ